MNQNVFNQSSTVGYLLYEIHHRYINMETDLTFKFPKDVTKHEICGRPKWIKPVLRG